MIEKGDIIRPIEKIRNSERFNGLYHPAIVWDFQGNDVIGIMLTHSRPNKKFANILMNPLHFEEGYSFQFLDTHFVNQLFIKFSEWGPFEIEGKLTNKGLSFIVENLTNTDYLDYMTYYRNLF